MYGNWNAPRAITLSALIYCLRCMVGEDIPLNQVQREGQPGGASPRKSWGGEQLSRSGEPEVSPAASSQGCLSPVRIVVPESSILHPSLDAGVVGGNVLTSQRVVDVIFRAFEVCAASQVRGTQEGQAGGLRHSGWGSHSFSARALVVSCRCQLAQEVLWFCG